MSAFFKNMSLSRVIIVLSLLGSMALAYLGYLREQEFADLELARDRRVPKLVGEIQGLSLQHTARTRQTESDELIGRDDMSSYIRAIAAEDRVEVGQLLIDPRSSPAGRRDIIDKRYTIKPADKKRSYERVRIANFAYTLEDRSRQVRVTRLKIENAKRRMKEHEIPPDTWTFEIDLTTRVSE